MNDFYNKEQKNGNISEEIKLTKDQINKLKIKDHVMQYIKDNDNVEEEKINDNHENNIFSEIKNDKNNENLSSNLFSGLNMNFNYNNFNDQNNNEEEGAEYTAFNLMNDDNNDNNDENIENKIKELNEKIQNAVKVSKFNY